MFIQKISKTGLTNKKRNNKAIILFFIISFFICSCNNNIIDYKSNCDPDIKIQSNEKISNTIIDNVGLKFNKYNIGNYINKSKVRRKLCMTVLHNSSSPSSLDFGLDSVKFFKQYHIYHNKWTTIGYHFIIDKYGNIYAGRDINYIGAHAGPGNENSIGVCLIGNFETTDNPTVEQKEAFSSLHIALRNKYYGLYNQNIRFHREFMATACPGKISINEVKKWVSDYEKKLPTPQKPLIFFNGYNIGEGILINETAYIKVRNFSYMNCDVVWLNDKNIICINQTIGKSIFE